jgi:hypothetical protein
MTARRKPNFDGSKAEIPRAQTALPAKRDRYEYKDESGEVIFAKVRGRGKVPWRYEPKNAPRRDELLLELPALLKAFADDAPRVWLAEGESDACAIRNAGEPATTHSGGGGNQKPGHAKWFADAAKDGWTGAISITVDADWGCSPDGSDKGTKSALKWHKLLVDAGFPTGRITFAFPTKGKDIRDHLESGRALDELYTASIADLEWRSKLKPCKEVTASLVKRWEEKWRAGEAGVLGRNDLESQVAIQCRDARLLPAEALDIVDALREAVEPDADDQEVSRSRRTVQSAYDLNGLPGGAVWASARKPDPLLLRGRQASALSDSRPSVSGRRIVRKKASDYKLRKQKWVWDGLVPLRQTTVLAGKGGIGKSTVWVDMVAKLTRGTLPGEFWGEPVNVLVAAYEDTWEETICPRLIAAGADMDRIESVDICNEEDEDEDSTGIVIPRDLDSLEDALLEVGAKVLVIDPLLSAMDGSLNTFTDRDVRKALDPLNRLARRTGLSVIALAHTKKDVADSDNALANSTAFRNAARSALLFTTDHEADDGSCLMFHNKSNLSEASPPQRYRIESAEIQTEEGTASVGRVVWLGDAPEATWERSAVRRADKGSATDDIEVEDAAHWLRDMVRGGVEWNVEDAVKAAKDGPSYSARLVKKAIKYANLGPHKESKYQGRWLLVLPEFKRLESEEDQ